MSLGEPDSSSCIDSPCIDAWSLPASVPEVGIDVVEATLAPPLTKLLWPSCDAVGSVISSVGRPMVVL